MWKRLVGLVLAVLILSACSGHLEPAASSPAAGPASAESSAPNAVQEEAKAVAPSVSDSFVRVDGGTYTMGSPESELWRSADESQHEVTVDAFWLDPYETTQEEYAALMGSNPAQFSGADLPVENVSWLEAVQYANARSEAAGLEPAYEINGTDVIWNREADGYRLPTEAEWEFAHRAGTAGPFNTDTSISALEANYYGYYPMILRRTTLRRRS